MSIPATIDPDSYTCPEPVYEDATLKIRAELVRYGDKVEGLGVATETIVARRWVHIAYGDGQKVQLDRDQEVTVVRHLQTQASRDAGYRAWTNRRLAERLVARKDLVEDALDSMGVAVASDGYASPSVIAEYLQAQAESRLLNELAGLAAKGDYEDLLEAAREFAEILKDRLIQDPHRALSRSSSVVHNLLEDCDREAWTQFIHDISGM